ncbi:MAG: RNA polymerase sigma factor [Tissierellia bacterium]|jgi:RNA polymerase sigma factor (sigma-70 family)|nr:RNA polymerase sigma factor [Bacillota bacterium]NLK57982.1 RNA polymerase sigma factor [Tissierellia bacterium]
MLQMLFLLALEEDSENTEALIRRIGQDDPDAFARFYQETERALYAYTLSLTKDHHDALDIMQDTYLKVRAAAHLYEPRGKPMAWVFTIAKNLTRDRFRAQSRFQDVEDGMEDDARFSYVHDATDRMVLETVLQTLSEEEREIVLLYAVQGYKHKEIAEALNLPLNTVLSKYRRALGKLRNELTKGGAL